jgi:hypothetical protein
MKSYAQQTLVDLKIDEADIIIGEQTTLHLSVTTDKDKQIIIPLPVDRVTEGIEVLHITPPDTTDIQNNRMMICYDLVITSFDSLLYLIPPFIAVEGHDTVFSNQVALKVSAPDVNLENPEEYYDIKNVWRPPFVLADYYALIYGVLFTLFFICMIGYFIQRMRSRPQKTVNVKGAPKLPPHEQAIKELNEIRERKLWQQGRNKEYYTEITDTLRRYISARYGVSVMEKTSAEILEVIRDGEPGNKDIYNTLNQILRLSDFVKFAKLHPLPDENDLSMLHANLFVERTKRVEIVTVPPQSDGNGEMKNKIDEPTNN